MIKQTMLNYMILFVCGAAVLLAALVFEGNGIIYLTVPVLQILLSWLNCRFSSRWQTVLILETHLLIATAVGFFLGGLIYLKFVSDDSDSRILLQFAVLVGAGMVFVMGLITTLYKYFKMKKTPKTIV